jgi:hypothetical protein
MEESKMMRKQWVVVLGFALMVFGMACRHTQEVTPKPLDKAAIEADIRSQIATHYPGKTFDIGIDVSDDGTVTLKGHVDDNDKRTRIVEIAQQTSGVRRVVNELEVQPGS